jgi:excisionase family DNA binding protein
MEEKLTYNVSEVCKLLGLSEPTLRDSIRRGEIPSIHCGHRILIPKSALSLYLQNAGAGNAK